MSRVRFEGWEAEVTPAGEGVHRIRIGGESWEVVLLRRGVHLRREGGLIVFETEGRVVSAVVRVEGGRAEVPLRPTAYQDGPHSQQVNKRSDRHRTARRVAPTTPAV